MSGRLKKSKSPPRTPRSVSVSKESASLLDKLTEKQKKVLESAIEIFAEKGFAQASTSEIARRAGVAEGTVFKRYATKKDLLLEIGIFLASKLSVPGQVRELQDVFSQPFEQVEDLFRAFLRNRLTFAQKNRKLLKVLIQEIPFHPELQRLIRDTMSQGIIPHASAALEKYKKRGQLRDIETLTILRMVGAQFMGFVLVRNLLAPDQSWDDEREIEIIVSTLMNGLKPN